MSDIPWPGRRNRTFKLRSDTAVAIGIAGAAMFVFLFIHGDLDWLLPQYWQGYYGEIDDPFNKGKKLDIAIDLKSPTFGALTVIDADVSVTQKDHHVANYNDTDQYRIWFDGSRSCVTDDPRYVNQFPCYFDLTSPNGTNAVIYQGSQKISYSRGGEFSIQLGDNSTSDDEKTTIADPFIFTSTETTNALYTFKIGAAIGITAATVGFLNWYQKYREYRLAKLGRD